LPMNSARMGFSFVLVSHHPRTDRPRSQHSHSPNNEDAIPKGVVHSGTRPDIPNALHHWGWHLVDM
jgi:hypothetical protein